MDQIKYQQPTAEEFRSVRYGIHRNVHRRTVAESNKRADADLAKWLAEQEAAGAADSLQVAA